ncbi:hypothetical protein BH11ACT8_BH11ACT8_35450 [soil metagenome]
MIDNRDSQLEMRWLPVTDDRGRTRMEAVWILSDEHAGATHAA